MNQARAESPKARLERQQNALLEISRRWRWFEADLDKAVAEVVEAATAALDIARSSVWFYNPERDALQLHDLYEADPRRHSHGTLLHAADYPEYFAALHDEEVIAAHDAHKDPRTGAFSEPYLQPLGIGAMLDAPVRLGGRLVGVLCNEHLGGARHFTTDEQNTATYLANMVSLAYEFQSRTRSEHETERAMSLLRAAFEASGAGILAVDTARKVNTYNRRFLELWDMPEELTGPAGDDGVRLRFVAARAADPDFVGARINEIYGDPEVESLDTFELADGRCLECVSLPQRLDGQVIGRVWSFRDVTYQKKIEAELRELSIRDGLTGLFNRRYAEEHLGTEIQRARRGKQPLSVAMLDIDRFKQVNDAHGHEVGDQVLRAMAEDMRARMRATDMLCRWGGEEFLLILPDTDRAGAVTVVDSLRRYVGRERKHLPRFTVSGGISEYDGAAKRWDTLVRVADRRLYEAKEAGRNRIC